MSDLTPFPQEKEEKSRFTLRISKELMDIVKKSAANNHRSAAMEIEYALDVYYLLLNNSDEIVGNKKIEDCFYRYFYKKNI